MGSRIERFLFLANLNFNVPLFLHNPWGSYGPDCVQVFKEFFFTNNKGFMIVKYDKEKGKSDFVRVKTPHEAALSSGFLERSGYEVLIYSLVPYEWRARVVLLRDNQCRVVFKSSDFWVRDLHNVSDLFLRSFLRRVLSVGKVFKEDVCLFVGKSKVFCGVNSSKSIVYDYLPIEIFS